MSAADGRPGWKGATVLALKVLLSVALMTFLFARVPAASVGRSLRHASPAWLGAAFGLLFLSNVLGSWQWGRLLAAVGIRIPFWKVCSYYHVGLFFNNFLPANIGGDIARVVDVTRYNTTTATAFSTVLMDRLIGTLALASLALCTTLPAIDRFHLGLAYAALIGFFSLSLALVWAVFHPGLLPLLERVLARVGLGGMKPHLDDLATRLEGFRDQRGLMLRVTSVALVVQVSRILVHVLVARALGLTIPLAYFFLFVPLLAVIVSLPISLNGIGLREGAGIVLFGLVGLGRAPAFALQFTTYLVAVAVSLLGGLIFLIRIPHRRAVARQTRRTN
ncbi:MAG: flippase-like domain-containing protein [Candidatus Eisenbacteria bacterium]|nr:flippase-like domain-containing protein [Candidatus Eisenbacteria bacterium]